MLYELFFYLNPDLVIFNQLGMVTIVTLFYLLEAKLILIDELYKSSLDKSLVSKSTIFFLDFT
jgi:hypothetical protein